MDETASPVIPKYPPGLRARGKRLWKALHSSGDFSKAPETMAVIEEACYLSDEIKRQRDLVRKAGSDTRVKGSNGQPVSMPEIADLRGNQQLLLNLLKAIRLDDEAGGKLSRSEAGRVAATARWGGR